MPITVLYESGTYEGLDKTIAYNLDTAWNAANTNGEKPKFHSAFAANVTHSWPRTFGTNEVHCNAESLEFLDETANGDSWHRIKNIVYIDIFARDSRLGELYCMEINRIFWDVLRPAATRIKKSDGTSNSRIAEFVNTELKFVKEKEITPQMKVYTHFSTQIELISYKTRT